MGNAEGRPTPMDDEILRDCASKCQLTFEELKTEYDLWLKKHPTGAVDESDCFKTLTQILPKYSKDDLKKVANHVFRVFDNDNNGKITFKEFMLVYNILAFGDIDETLGKVFLIFDIDYNGTISKKEMNRVMKDLSILFDERGKKAESEDVFKEMDGNKDQRITKEEFIKSIKEGNKYGQNLANRLVQLYNARK